VADVTEIFLGKLMETIRLTVILKICYFWPQIPLARIFHELPAATEDMTVLAGVLGCRTLRRTVQVRLGPNPAVPRDGCPGAQPSPRSGDSNS